jgi:MraZ protein
MSAFIGEYTCKVDNKGRILFPAALKKQVPSGEGERFVVKKDIFDRCLVLYSMDEWNRQNELIRSRINPYNKEHNTFLRNFYRGAAEIVLDGNNRMLIPRRLLASVGIDKTAVLAGMGSKIEIWAEEVYDSVQTTEDAFAKLAEKIMGDGDKENER